MFDKIKRKLRYELVCVNMTTLAVSSAVFAAVCIINSIVNVKSAVYEKFTAPKISLSPFFCILFWVLMSALLGAVLAIIISSPSKNKRSKMMAPALCLCVFVLENAWIVLVYSAASFFIAMLVSAVMASLCAALFNLALKMNALAAAGTAVYAAWLLYAFYFSAATAFLS